MNKTRSRYIVASACLLAAFAVWSALVRCVDVQAIGPQGTKVGFAAINGFVHTLTGVHMILYEITDWLGLVPVTFGLGFALVGLVQWVKRKRLLLVDRSILALGGIYLVMLAVYLLFEEVVINYRPILIDGCLEASYPSSTTVLVLCVMPTAIMQLHRRIRHRKLRRSVTLILWVFTAFMTAGRLISGVHWLSDIIGGVLVSAGFVMLYLVFSLPERESR